MLKTIRDIKDIRGKKILLRLDLNVPIEDGIVLDDFRIKSSLRTLNYLKDSGAKIVIISHIGKDGSLSLINLAKNLDVPLLDLKMDDNLKQKINNLKEGDVVMLENLRKDSREKNNDESFARELSSLCDIFVNEAFSVSHRSHASVVLIPKFLPSYFGFLFEEEVDNLSKAFKPEHPFIFILGGAKFETKIPLIKKFLNIADKIFIGGALANNLIKASGREVGISLVDDNQLDLKEFINNPKIFFPKDVLIISKNITSIKTIDEILPEDKIVDVGPKFTEEVRENISSSKFILWNGPLGITEESFGESSKSLAKSISNPTNIISIIGGGDTVAVVKDLNILEKFNFVSTGGGAMLDFLASGTLPGIEAIEEGAIN